MDTADDDALVSLGEAWAIDVATVAVRARQGGRPTLDRLWSRIQNTASRQWAGGKQENTQ